MQEQSGGTVDGALNALLVQKILKEETNQRIVEHTLQMLDDALNEVPTSEHNENIKVLNKLLHNVKLEVSLKPTGKLWAQYMVTVDILRSAPKAQRTGKFLLYLKSLNEMLPYLAASGHNSYTKSIHLFLQNMLNLKDTNPSVFQEFLSGNMFVRRSDRF